MSVGADRSAAARSRPRSSRSIQEVELLGERLDIANSLGERLDIANSMDERVLHVHETPTHTSEQTGTQPLASASKQTSGEPSSRSDKDVALPEELRGIEPVARRLDALAVDRRREPLAIPGDEVADDEKCSSAMSGRAEPRLERVVKPPSERVPADDIVLSGRSASRGAGSGWYTVSSKP